MVHTGVAWPYSACRSGSGLNEGLGISDEQRVLTPREQPLEVSIEGHEMLSDLRDG